MVKFNEEEKEFLRRCKIMKAYDNAGFSADCVASIFNTSCSLAVNMMCIAAENSGLDHPLILKGPYYDNNIVDHITHYFMAVDNDETQGTITVYQAILRIDVAGFLKGQKIDMIDFKLTENTIEFHVLDLSETQPVAVIKWE